MKSCLVMIAALTAGVAGFPTPSAAAPPTFEAGCQAITGLHVPAEEIALPTRGAVLELAGVVPAMPGTPGHCKVIGYVAPMDRAATAYRIEIDLPQDWNGKALQKGGGGVNGHLVDPTTPLSGMAPDVPSALARGYTVFASDGGHEAPDGSFALNPETFANYAGDELKKTRDVAVALMRRFYGRAPEKTYFLGYSEGGREALIAAQRFGSDYDGIVAGAPVYSLQAEEMANVEMMKHLYAPGGWLDPASTRLLVDAVYQACDGLDGLVDGVISAPQRCHVDPASLRCPKGAGKPAACLSDAQIVAARAIGSPVSLPLRLANGVTSYQGYPLLKGGVPTVFGFGSGPVAHTPAAFGQDAALLAFADAVVRYQVARDPALDLLRFDPAAFQDAALKASRLTDATSPDLSGFIAHGGKLILFHGLGDMAVSPDNTVAYQRQIVDRHGAGVTDGFLRFFLIPGFDHGVGVFKAGWDELSALEDWREKGIAPKQPVVADFSNGSRGRERPLCAYPLWPAYIGGDAAKAGSFTCHVP